MTRVYGEVNGYVMSEAERDLMVQEKVSMESEIRKLKSEVMRLSSLYETSEKLLSEQRDQAERDASRFLKEIDSCCKTIIALTEIRA